MQSGLPAAHFDLLASAPKHIMFSIYWGGLRIGARKRNLEKERRERKKTAGDSARRKKSPLRKKEKRRGRRNGNYRILGRTRTRSAATNTLVRGPLLGKSSRLRLIPVVRKEAKGAPRGRTRETGEPGTYKMKTRSEMIKLRIFLAYAGIKGGLREMECLRLDGRERLDRVSFIYGQYHQNMVSFKNHRAPKVRLVVVVSS